MSWTAGRKSPQKNFRKLYHEFSQQVPRVRTASFTDKLSVKQLFSPEDEQKILLALVEAQYQAGRYADAIHTAFRGLEVRPYNQRCAQLVRQIQEKGFTADVSLKSVIPSPTFSRFFVPPPWPWGISGRFGLPVGIERF